MKANNALSFRGICLVGDGFVLTPAERSELLNLEPAALTVIKPFFNGQDLVQRPRGLFLIDLNGMTEEQVRTLPNVYQRIYTTVRPHRLQQNDKQRKDKWWLFGRNNQDMRTCIRPLTRFIVTCMTAKHRTFTFVDGKSLPDQGLIAIGLADSFFLGVLTSRLHTCFALATGGTLEDRPRYNNSVCFEHFPFPVCAEPDRDRIRKTAEELDIHRKKVQTAHDITLTGMYNVLEKLRAGEELNAKEKAIHDKGLVSVLKQLHDDLDAAVFAAYGWPTTLTDAEILERLVALNAERAAEEKRGIIHWLRPEYQIKAVGGQSAAPELNLPESEPQKSSSRARRPAPLKKAEWPKTLAARVQAVEAALHRAAAPVSPEALAKQFTRARPGDLKEILETLATLGRAHQKGASYTR